MPSLMWSLILVALMAPIHVVFVSPVIKDMTVGVAVAVGYFCLGMLWTYVGDRIGMIRR